MSYDTTQRLNGVAHVISCTVRSDDGVNYDRRKTTYYYYHHLHCNYIIIDIIVLTEILVHTYSISMYQCTCNNVEQTRKVKVPLFYNTRTSFIFYIINLV